MNNIFKALDLEYIELTSGNRYPSLNYIDLIIRKFGLESTDIMLSLLQEACQRGEEFISSGGTIKSPRFWLKYQPIKIIQQLIKEKKDHGTNLSEIIRENFNHAKKAKNIADESMNKNHKNSLLCTAIISNKNQFTDEKIIANEYFYILTKRNLSDSDLDRLSDIIDSANSNDNLSILLNEIDYLVANKLDFLSEQNSIQYLEKLNKLAGHLRILIEVEAQGSSKILIDKNTAQLLSEASQFITSHEKKQLESLIQNQERDLGFTEISDDALKKLTPQQKKIASDYYKLLTMNRWGESEADRLCEIFEILESDELLRLLCNAVDYTIIGLLTEVDNSE